MSAREDLLATFKDIVRDHHELMGYPPAFPSEQPRAVVLELVRRPAVEETCERCGGWLMHEVSNPESARCMACGEPVRRIT